MNRSTFFQWSKIKYICLMAFVIVNALFLYMYLRPTNNIATKPPETIQTMFASLDNAGVSLDPTIIPVVSETTKTFEVSRGFTVKDELAVKLLGEGYFMKNERTMYKDSAELLLSNNDFEFVIKIVEDEPLSDETIKNARKTADNYLKDKNLSNKYMELADTIETNSTIRYTYTMKYDKKPVFVASIAVDVNNQGVVRAVGTNWLGDTIIEGTFVDLCDISEVLNSLTKLAEEKQWTDITVSKFTLGYYYSNRGTENIVTATPAWEIITSDGTVTLFNASTGLVIN